MKTKCPECKSDIQFEDHSSVGGPKRYWSCTKCDQEMIMFVRSSLNEH